MMNGVFMTKAVGKELADQISLMNKMTTEFEIRAARGECGWICSDCGMSFPDGMPDACAHGIQRCTDIIASDKTESRKQGGA
jgi:hypothetical protein